MLQLPKEHLLGMSQPTCSTKNSSQCVIIGGERERAPYLDVVNGSRVFPYVSTYIRVHLLCVRQGLTHHVIHMQAHAQ